MKSRLCPYRNNCHDAGDCETCDFERVYARLNRKIKKLQADNALLREKNKVLQEKIEALRGGF